jgi:hypothetical protein
MHSKQISLLAAFLAGRVEYAVVGGLAIPFISKADLIENKRQAGRLRDLADIEELTRLPED